MRFPLNPNAAQSVPKHPEHGARRRGLATSATRFLLGAAAAAGLGLASLPASAANLTCASGVFYSIGDNGTLWKVDDSGSTASVAKVFDATDGSGAYNGLGISSGGATAYSYIRTEFDHPGPNTWGVHVFKSNGDTGWTPAGSAIDLGLHGDTFITGAVNLASNQYYFGASDTTTGSSNGFHVWKYDDATNTATLVAHVVGPQSDQGDNGDMAFDNQGNLYIVESSGSHPYIYTVTAAQLAGAGGGNITGTEVDDFSLNADTNGLAFDSNGSFYIGSNSEAWNFLPGPSAVANLVTNDLHSSSDLASCESPATFMLQKNIAGRENASDQFTLSGGVQGGVTFPGATTSGASNGIQSAHIGPIPVQGSAVINFSEAMASGSTSTLAAYTASWSCVDTANGSTPTTGSGPTGSVTIPSDVVQPPAVVCTFTNRPLAESLTLTKTADPTVVAAVGATVTYTFGVTNSGGVQITGLQIIEDTFTGSAGAPAATCAATTLAAGASTTCSATYTVTQADINAGVINNTAHATGTAAGTTVNSAQAHAQVTATQTEGLVLSKSVNPASVNAAGTQVTYTFSVTNTGDTTINGITIGETAFTGSGTLGTVTCGATSLAGGASTTCTATYDVTQADINAGKIDNTATATGTDVGTDDTVTSNPSSAEVKTPGMAAIAPIPTLGEWGLLLLAGLLGGVGVMRMRRKHG